jgi:hypothetical protein
VAVVFVVYVIVVVVVVVVEEEVALTEVLEVVVEGEGDLVVEAVEEVGEEQEDEDVDVEVEVEEVGIFFHLGTFETVTILTGHHRRF